MGSVSRRLDWLEEQARETTENEQGVISREALGRISTEDLRLVHAYLKRAVEGNAEPTEEEGAAIFRYEEIKEEVRNEH